MKNIPACVLVLRNLSNNGRVVVVDPDVTLSAQVNGQRFFYVAGVSTLVSRYLRVNPAKSVSRAQHEIARFLDIPAEFGVQGTFGDSWHSSFSWSAFKQSAGATPLDEFIDLQVAAASQGQSAYFRQPHPYPALYSALGSRLHPGIIPDGVVLLGPVRAQEGEAAAGFLKTLVDNVTADVIATSTSSR